MATETRNGNLLVWKSFLVAQDSPIDGTEAFYCNPKGDVLRRLKNAKPEVQDARDNWDKFEPFRVRGPLQEKLARLFEDKPNILTSGGETRRESPFAVLAKLKAK